MARYDDSWRREIKTMFVPLPLNAIKLKIDEKQNERDVLSQQLEGDLNVMYDRYATDANAEVEKRNKFRQDLDNIRNQMNNTWDLGDVAASVRNIQRQYGINPGIAISGTSGGTGGGGNGSGPNYLMGTENEVLEANYKSFVEAEKFYADTKDVNADAYNYVFNIARSKQERQRQETEGTPQQYIQRELIKPFDMNKFENELGMVSEKFRTDGSSSNMVDIGAGYLGIKDAKFITTDDAYKVFFGHIMGSDEYQKHLNVMFEYQYGENPEAINQLARPQIEDEVMRTYYKEGMSDAEFRKIIQNNDKKIQTEIDGRLQQLKEEEKKQLASKQYRYDESKKLVDKWTEVTDFYIPDKSNVKEGEGLLQSRALNQYNLENGGNVSTTKSNISTKGLSPKDKKENVKNLQETIKTNETIITNQRSTLRSLRGNLFGNNQATTGDARSGITRQDDIQYQKAIENGAIVENNDGTIAVNYDNPFWQGKVPNADVIFEYNKQAQIMNNSQIELANANTIYGNIEKQYKESGQYDKDLRKSFENSDYSKDEILVLAGNGYISVKNKNKLSYEDYKKQYENGTLKDDFSGASNNKTTNFDMNSNLLSWATNNDVQDAVILNYNFTKMNESSIYSKFYNGLNTAFSSTKSFEGLRDENGNDIYKDVLELDEKSVINKTITQPAIFNGNPMLQYTVNYTVGEGKNKETKEKVFYVPTNKLGTGNTTVNETIINDGVQRVYRSGYSTGSGIDAQNKDYFLLLGSTSISKSNGGTNPLYTSGTDAIESMNKNKTGSVTLTTDYGSEIEFKYDKGKGNELSGVYLYVNGEKMDQYPVFEDVETAMISVGQLYYDTNYTGLQMKGDFEFNKQY